MFTPDVARAEWRKGSRSTGANNCVEVAAGVTWAALRDSKDPDGPALVCPAEGFTTFLAAAKRGAFNLSR